VGSPVFSRPREVEDSLFLSEAKGEGKKFLTSGGSVEEFVGVLVVLAISRELPAFEAGFFLESPIKLIFDFLIRCLLFSLLLSILGRSLVFISSDTPLHGNIQNLVECGLHLDEISFP
jgi:hypothetical protein